MPRIQQNSMPTSLHYALTDSQCGVCGGQLEWKANFNDINQPKYTAQHCNQDYAIHIDAVKIEVVTHKVGTEATRRRKKHKLAKEIVHLNLNTSRLHFRGIVYQT